MLNLLDPDNASTMPRFPWCGTASWRSQIKLAAGSGPNFFAANAR
jgi:hypothetical protein